MRNIARFPFGAILLIFLVPYIQWQRFGVDFSLAQATRLALIFVTVTIGCMAFFYWRLRSWDNIGLIATLIACAAVASFGILFPIIVFWSLLILTTVVERKIDYRRMIFAGNVLVAATVVLYLPAEIRTLGFGQVRGAAYSEIGRTELTAKPSIMHVVLDGYGATDVLSDIYGHDNTEFRQALKNMGFTVMDRVFTPYNQTLYAMASVMSGGYVEVLENKDDISVYRHDLAVTTTNGNVQKALRREGYNFAYVGSGIAGLDLDDARELNPPPFLSPTSMEVSFVLLRGLFLKYRNDRLRAAFDPGNFSKLQPPFYYYQHVLAPHPPFSMTPSGDPRPAISQHLSDGSHFVRDSARLRAKYIEGYRDMAGYTERALVRQLSAMPTDKPIVVIIHGDHGPGAYLYQEDYELTCAAERMTTFLAVYSNVPEIRDAFAKYKGGTFNIVNIYRILFSAISPSGFAPLPSVTTFVPYVNAADARRFSDERLAQPCVAPG